MILLTRDPGRVRAWAGARGMAPALTLEGELTLVALPGAGCAPLSWEEFAGLFTVFDLALQVDRRRRGIERWRIVPRG